MYIRLWAKQIDTNYDNTETPMLHLAPIMDSVQS